MYNIICIYYSQNFLIFSNFQIFNFLIIYNSNRGKKPKFQKRKVVIDIGMSLDDKYVNGTSMGERHGMEGWWMDEGWRKLRGSSLNISGLV